MSTSEVSAGGMDTIWDALINRVGARSDTFRMLDRFRLRPDPWLKIELIAALTELERDGAVHHLRPDHRGCDVSFNTIDGEYWLAVKGLITSYAGNAREVRSTLPAVEEVARELDKLRGLAGLAGGQPVLLLAAFPFGPEPRERNEWQAQLLRFEAKGVESVRDLTVDLAANRTARVWLFA
jgi:hypothetical protein